MWILFLYVEFLLEQTLKFSNDSAAIHDEYEMSQYEYMKISMNRDKGHFYTLLNALYNNVHSSPVHIQINIYSSDLQDEIFTEYEK